MFPRDKNTWVFISYNKKGFMDNCKYLFLYLNLHNQGVCKFIWLTKNRKILKILKERGYRANSFFSPKGIMSLLRAEYFIFDSYLSGISFWLSGRGKKINLWHGVGVKKIENDIKRGKLSKIYQSKGIKKQIMRFFFPHIFLNFQLDFLICTSPLFKKIFFSAFRTKKERILITGYPRNDIFFREMKDVDIGTSNNLSSKMVNFKSQNKTKKIVLYAPTFRDTKEDVFKKDTQRLLLKLNNFCRENNVLFIFKPHSNSVKIFKDEKNKKLSNIYFATENQDIYPFLSSVDILITDYSSIFSDFLLLDRPIIFFPYDIDKYKIKDREFYFDYNEFTPGPKVYNIEELLETIKSVASGNDEYLEKRKKIREACFQDQDGNSSKRIFNSIYDKA
jgi:CDP-glycerol glycerophosphotransferase (TagB/SpsB family)